MPELSAMQLIIGFLLLLTPVVYFRELGHYWVARKAGVVVEVFSIGFGPEIYGWTSKTGTRWRIAAIHLADMFACAVMKMRLVRPLKLPNLYPAALLVLLGWRIGIVAAGPIANFILGIALFASVYMTAGKVFPPAEIGEVLPETAAAEADFNQIFVTDIDGISIRNFNDMRGLVVESPGRQLTFTLVRDGNEMSLLFAAFSF